MMDESFESIESLSVGQVLRSAREEKGLSLDAVAKVLCISKRQLIPLEEDSELLVCDVYTLGFLRSYALFLGLDEEELVQKFKDKAASPQVHRISFPAPLPGRGMPTFRILGLSLLVIVVGIAGWEWFGYQGPAPFPIEENLVVDAKPNLYSPSLDLESEPKKSLDEAVALNPPLPILLTVTEKTWIEVKDQNGIVILSHLFQPGETQEFKDSQNLVLNTGNINGIRLSAGEKIYSFSEGITGLKADIPLDPEKWLEQNSESH